MTLEQVRDATGGAYKPTRLSNYERGERPVTIQTLFELATTYSCPPSYLLPTDSVLVDWQPMDLLGGTVVGVSEEAVA